MPAHAPPPTLPIPADGPRKPLAVWLAGTIRWGDYLSMAERLAGEVADPRGRNPTLVVCELEPCITIGRGGSRADVRLSDDHLRGHRIPLAFTGRGGGAVLHGPGQVVAALFASLADLGLDPDDVGGYVARFQAAVAAAIRSVRCGSAAVHPGVHGVFGRTGLLAALGVAVRRGVACHGAFVNVCPAVDLFPRIDTLPARLRPAAAGPLPTTMSSLEADVQRRVRLQDVRTAVVRQMADAFALPRTHVNAGFPFRIDAIASGSSEVVTRVG